MWKMKNKTAKGFDVYKGNEYYGTVTKRVTSTGSILHTIRLIRVALIVADMCKLINQITSWLGDIENGAVFNECIELTYEVLDPRD